MAWSLVSPPMTLLWSELLPPQVEATSPLELLQPAPATLVVMAPSLDGEGLAVRSIHCWLNHLVDLELYWWIVWIPGSCSLPSALQGVDPMPIISDSECTSRWGSSFNSALMICVYNGSQGSCNVSLNKSIPKICIYAQQHGDHILASIHRVTLVAPWPLEAPSMVWPPGECLDVEPTTHLCMPRLELKELGSEAPAAMESRDVKYSTNKYLKQFIPSFWL